MICNLWHIKQTNGLYYYALDYLRAIEVPSTVYVRPALLELARAALPAHQVVATGIAGIVRTLAVAFLRGEQIFTPTSHPVPLHRRQLVVVHDDYPFLGRGGWLKRLLFRAGVYSSRCEVGHINHTTSLDALRGIAIHPLRLRYMPNSPPDTGVVADLRALRSRPRAPVSGRLRVALFGSDSPKKRYECLFDVVRRRRPERYRFEVYGHANAYLHNLQQEYPDFDIHLVPSSNIELPDFLASIDAVASVASHEGFGRPVALALAAGIPAFLLHSPVFSEFFARSTRLHADIDALADALDVFDHMHETAPGVFAEQISLERAFEAAKTGLCALAERRVA